MYVNKVGNLNRKDLDIMDTIEGTDIFNSKFIYELSNYKGKLYNISVGEGRLDIILMNIMSSINNYGTNYVLNRITDNSSIQLGKVIELMSESDIDAVKNLM